VIAMPSQILEYQFVPPKTVTSGNSIGLHVKVNVANGPKTLTLSSPTGHKVDPSAKDYPSGEHSEVIPVVVTGGRGTCEVQGTLATSEATDAVEVR
jgi:hypothetical protein